MVRLNKRGSGGGGDHDGGGGGGGGTLKTPPSGGDAAALLGIITLILILYIVFLPADERAKLLEDDTNPDGSSGLGAVNRTLLRADIGTLNYLAQTRQDHPIPNLVLRESKNAVVFEDYNPFIVRRGFLTNDEEVLTFSVEDPTRVTSAYLSFDAAIRDGPLEIILNDKIVFEGEPQSVNVGPIELRKDLIQATNELIIQGGSVGLRFWDAHRYSIENAKVVGDVSDTTTQESLNAVVLSSEEIREFEKATLEYVPVCSATTGKLSIYVNNRLVSSAVPLCGSPNKQELDASDLIEGKNAIFFKVDQGTYQLEQIRLKMQLKKPVPFVEYFDVSADDLELIRRGRKAFVRMSFVDDKQEKVGDLSVNGRLISIQQDDPILEQDVSRVLTQGQNYVRVTPKSTLNIQKLEVIIR